MRSPPSTLPLLPRPPLCELCMPSVIAPEGFFVKSNLFSLLLSKALTRAVFWVMLTTEVVLCGKK